MNHETALTIEPLRLARLEELAEAHHKHAIENGNFRRASRAASLVMAVSSRWWSIVGGEISAYRD